MIRLWESHASAPLQRLVQWLSVSVETDESALEDAILAMCESEMDQAEMRNAVDLLPRCSFVSRTAGGFAVREEIAVHLARAFRERAASEFENVHMAFYYVQAERLQTLEVRASPLDRWRARVELSFFQCGFDPLRAEVGFANAFDSISPEDAIRARAWLVRLGLRQEYLLGSQSRTVRFMRAFGHYIAGRRQQAADGFADLISDSIIDPYQAIALHLWASAAVTTDDRAIESLDRSIAYSAKLDLPVNEVMARNSLVYRLLRVGETPRASRMAELNLAQSRRMGDPGLIVFTLLAHVSAAAPTIGAAWEGVDPQIFLDELAEAEEWARKIGDLESETLAVNQTALIVRSTRGSAPALNLLLSWLRSGVTDHERPQAAHRLGQTLGSMRPAQLDDVGVQELSVARKLVDRWRS